MRVKFFPDEIALGNLVIIRNLVIMGFSVYLCQRKSCNKHLRFSIHVSHASFIPSLLVKRYASCFCLFRTCLVLLVWFREPLPVVPVIFGYRVVLLSRRPIGFRVATSLVPSPVLCLVVVWLGGRPVWLSPRVCVVILRNVFEITSHVESRGRTCFSGFLVPSHTGLGVMYGVSSVSKLCTVLMSVASYLPIVGRWVDLDSTDFLRSPGMDDCPSCWWCVIWQEREGDQTTECRNTVQFCNHTLFPLYCFPSL
jgi:hypothetical protein